MAMVPVKSIPQKPYQTALHFIQLCLTFYIYLGFIKFSLIEKKAKFRKLIFVAMVFSIIQSLIAITATLLNKEIFKFNGVPFALECLLLFYAFKSVQNTKITYFKTLSRLCLYLFVLLIPILPLVLLGKEQFAAMPRAFILTLNVLAIVAAVIVFLIWFFKVRLFKKISSELY